MLMVYGIGLQRYGDLKSEYGLNNFLTRASKFPIYDFHYLWNALDLFCLQYFKHLIEFNQNVELKVDLNRKKN